MEETSLLAWALGRCNVLICDRHTRTDVPSPQAVVKIPHDVIFEFLRPTSTCTLPERTSPGLRVLATVCCSERSTFHEHTLM